MPIHAHKKLDCIVEANRDRFPVDNRCLFTVVVFSSIDFVCCTCSNFENINHKWVIIPFMCTNLIHHRLPSMYAHYMPPPPIISRSLLWNSTSSSANCMRTLRSLHYRAPLPSPSLLLPRCASPLCFASSVAGPSISLEAAHTP